MVLPGNVSFRSLAAFVVSVTVLVLFAWFGLWQVRQIQSEKEIVAQAPVPEAQVLDQPAAAQAKDVAPGVWEAAPEPKEPAPESTVKELVQAWNAGDVDRIAALFLPDGVLRIPTGSEIHSREEIKKTIAEHRKGMLSETTLNNTVEGVSKDDNDKAVVKGTYHLNGIKLLGFSTSSEGTYEVKGVRHNGRWMIAKAELTRK